MRRLKHFDLSEFACHHCGEINMDQDFLDRLDFAREVAGVSFHINSGFRCEEHDKYVGGKGNHTTGKAVDLRCDDTTQRLKMIQTFLRLGFKRIGIAKTFIHVDACDDRPEGIWVY